ncbi:MAG: hypothetical protein DRJ05_05310 [Bacteroidetes bacterium]|nr:MAG: hypothetical protein DRJ05_05310 [Bacteroidota bacterium]
MKKLNLTLVLVIISALSFAGIFTVDNRTGSGANYTTIFSAMNAATDGDTIYIHPSSIDYGNFSLSKSLVFIGPGHHPEYTGGMGATIQTVSLYDGSSYSKFIGLIIKEIKCSVWQTSHNIEISNNFFNSHRVVKGAYGDDSRSNNWLIQGNVMAEITGGNGFAIIDIETGDGDGLNSNWIIRNNFIQTKNVQSTTQVFSDLNSTIIVENNIFLHRNTATIFKDNVIGGDFRNNIFWATNNAFVDITVNANNVVFSNNLTWHTDGILATLPGNDNIDNADPDFTFFPVGNQVWDYENNYMLTAISPGHNAGTDGTDVGIYGSGFPFRMEGYPQDFPRLQSFDISNTVVPPGGMIEINLKATKAGL